MGIYTQDDKLMPLSEAIKKYVNDGDKVAFGGALILREPIAAIYELIRQRKRNLHILGTAHGFDVDIACAGGIVGVEQHTYVAYEFVYRGGCPNYRRAVEQGKIIEKEDGCYSIIAAMRAASYGLTYYPSHFFHGTEDIKFHPEYKEITCPFTGRKLMAIPPIEPDVSIVHVYKADRRGNGATGAPLIADILMVRSAKKVILTSEEIVDTSWFTERQAAIVPYFETTAVCHVPFGAHPTACYLYYTYDKDFLNEYIEYARSGDEKMEEWLQKYVYSVENQQEYLKKVGEDRLKKIRDWRKIREEAEALKAKLKQEWVI